MLDRRLRTDNERRTEQHGEPCRGTHHSAIQRFLSGLQAASRLIPELRRTVLMEDHPVQAGYGRVTSRGVAPAGRPGCWERYRGIRRSEAYFLSCSCATRETHHVLTNGRGGGGPGFACACASVDRLGDVESSSRPETPAAAVESDDPRTLIFSQLHALAQLHRRVQAVHYRRQFSVNLGECQLMGIVHALGRPSCKRICEVGGLDKAQVSRLVNRLTRQGLLVRSVHPKRRRTVNVTLTARGRTLARLLRAAALRLNRESLSTIPPADRAILSTIMGVLTDKVRLMLHEQRHGEGRQRRRSPLGSLRSRRRSRPRRQSNL